MGSDARASLLALIATKLPRTTLCNVSMALGKLLKLTCELVFAPYLSGLVLGWCSRHTCTSRVQHADGIHSANLHPNLNRGTCSAALIITPPHPQHDPQHSNS